MEQRDLYLEIIKKMQVELVTDNAICPETDLEFTVLMSALRTLKIDLEAESE